MGAFLVALQTRQQGATMIDACARAMQEYAVPIDIGQNDLVDIVGTGGTIIMNHHSS